LVRIPGTLNSKNINKDEDMEVKIIQRWDGKTLSIHPLLRHFRRWLIQKRIDDIQQLKKQEKKHAKFHMSVSQAKDQERTNTITKKIKWIEKGILEHPLSDHRVAEEVSNLMNTKYGWNDGLIVEITSHKEQIE
jgi:hypothetical protein